MIVRRSHVSIVLSDHSVIFKRLGAELQDRIEGIDLNDAPDPSADINYYITSACRKCPMPTLEMGLFPHMERTPERQKLFIETARELDLSVCMSAIYRDFLKENGIGNTTLILPGVDLERFRPKLRIGVVGNASNTDHKDEGLIARLMDMEAIDWHSTGTGWPWSGGPIPEPDLPDFYRSMDFILVPEFYERGPMCVPEALAVGTPVITSDVNGMPEFPHIPFLSGDSEDLRRALTEQLELKNKLRISIENYTWDAYAEAHDRAFHDLMQRADKSGHSRKAVQAAPFVQPVRLLLHGHEATTLGGPTVRVPHTAKALRAQGVPATAGSHAPTETVPEDIVHLFNVWHPHTALAAMRQIKQTGKKVIFSPIYIDLGERDFWHGQLPDLPLEDLDALAQTYAAAKAHQHGRGRLAEAVPGYNAMVREMLDMADHVIFLSDIERRALEAIGAVVEDDRASLIRNPVDANLWTDGAPELFRDTYLKDLPGPQDYVVCVGRIETRKNQLLLARAVRDLPIRLVLIGHDSDPSYAEKVRQAAGDEMLIVGRLEHGGKMLRSALKGARAFVLPSWAEGASLAALEAAAAGANMVLSDRSSEREYFGDLAHYCDPGDPESIQAAIEAAMATEKDQAKALQDLVTKQNSWARYAEDTAKVYACAATASVRKTKAPAPTPRVTSKMVFDITTLAHHTGQTTGISRAEATLAKTFQEVGQDPTFICWNDSINRFIEMPGHFARLHQAAKYCRHFDSAADAPNLNLPRDCTVIVQGNAWMQNEHYVRGLEDLKMATDCSLYSIIHDLAPIRFPFWFDRDYAPKFQSNFLHLVTISDKILTTSEKCTTDVHDLLRATEQPCPPIGMIRWGDSDLTSVHGENEHAPGSVRAAFTDKKFVLAVGAIHMRKNYEMLYRVWARFADEDANRDLHLVIVGGVSRNGQELADRIDADPRVNDRIHILSGIEDADLAWLYETCLFTALPSHYEGWPLPVAESLVHGKLCLASSASSVPEIAPEVVEHIDPEDFVSWHAKISFYAASTAARTVKENAIRQSYTPVPWSKTAQQISATVAEPRVVRGLVPQHPGKILTANTHVAPLSLRFGDGWNAAESWGRWAATERVRVTVNAAQALYSSQDAVRVLLRQRAYVHDSQKPFELKVETGMGHALFCAQVTGHTFPSEIIVTVPTTDIAEDGLLSLGITMPVVREKGSVSRMLGYGLLSITLLDTKFSNTLQSLSASEHWIDGAVPAKIDFLDDTHKAICGPDLAFSPAWGAGSDMGSFTLMLPIAPGAPSQDLVVNYRPIATIQHPVKATFRCNGHVINEATLANDQIHVFRARLNAETLISCSPSVLSVETNSLLSPQDLGLSPFPTIAGLGILDLTLTPTAEKE